MGNKLTLTAVGDVFLAGTVLSAGGKLAESNEELGKIALDKVLPYFQESDINFCNLEAALSSKGTPHADRTVAFRAYPSMVEVLKKGKIDFVSLANNHTMDYGWEALAETMDLLRENKIGFAGGGRDVTEARKPAMVTKKGVTVGLLSYATNIRVPSTFRATQEKPGVAWIRVSPYFPDPNTNQEDVEAMQEDVEKSKHLLDFLIVSCHWGISAAGTHTIASHQKGIGHAAIEAGADLVLGHHPHMVQGIEIYKDKLICHSLGNFIFSLAGYPCDTIIFQCEISPHEIRRAKFLPAFTSREGQPEVLSPASGKGLEITSLMRKLSLRLGTGVSETGEIALP